MRVIRGMPLLDQPLIDAVRQWEFEPTMVDGRAGRVVVTVEHVFKAH